MSFTIYDATRNIACYYNSDKEEFHFQNTMLEGDVKAGLQIPIRLQGEMKNRTFLPYPPGKEDVRLFAIAYRKIIFERELVKHGFTIEEEKHLLSGRKV